MTKDPRHEPQTMPPGADVSSVRRLDIIEERVSKLPRPPPERASDPFFSFVQSHQEHAERSRAELAADLHEHAVWEEQLRTEQDRKAATNAATIVKVAGDMDNLLGRAIGLDARVGRMESHLGRFEDRLVSISESQMIHTSRIEGLKRQLEKIQFTTEHSIADMKNRMESMERRQDELENGMRQIRMLMEQDIAARHAQWEHEHGEAASSSKKARAADEAGASGDPDSPNDPSAKS